MFEVKRLDLTELEAKALWLRAELGTHVPCPELERDAEMRQAEESALRKAYRAYRGMEQPAPVTA